MILSTKRDSWFHEIFFFGSEFPVFSQIGAQCWNYGNSLSLIFGKNSVKVTVLLDKLLENWFDEIVVWWEKNAVIATVWGAQCGNFKIFPSDFFAKIPSK